MTNVQEYFDQKFSEKGLNLINLKGKELGFQGNELIIEDYFKLKSLIIQDTPHLAKIVIKNCKNLSSIELYSDREIEVNLQGEFPKLSN